MAKPLILVTNDDELLSWPANINWINEFLGDVVVVAPDSPQSEWGMLSLLRTLYSKRVVIDQDKGAPIEYSCSGTADCVKLALQEILTADQI